MGRGDNQLTFDDDAMAADEVETRRLLARYGQPRALDPPAALAGRVIDALSEPPPRPTNTLRRIYGGAVLICVCAVFALGTWGMLSDSNGTAWLFTVTAKPLINLLNRAGAAILVMIAAFLGGSWLWWQRLRRKAHSDELPSSADEGEEEEGTAAKEYQ